LICGILRLGIFRPIQSKAIPYQPLPEIGAGYSASRYCAPVAVKADRKTAYRPTGNERIQIIRCLRTAPVLLTVFAAAKLAALGRIDAPKPDPGAVNFDRVAVNDAGLSRHIVGQGDPARKQQGQPGDYPTNDHDL
jgi:hypothetical protein